MTCCFKFRSNRFKKENSRKQNIPFWRGAVECTFEHFSCKGNLKILKKNSNNICVTFAGKIKHSSLKVKRRKTTGENLLNDSESSSKLHRLGLLKLSGDQLASGKRTGPSRSALNNISIFITWKCWGIDVSYHETTIRHMQWRWSTSNEKYSETFFLWLHPSFKYDRWNKHCPFYRE